MSAAQERRTLARLSVAAGSAMTLAAAWLGVLGVDRPAAAPDGADPSLALAQDAILAATATGEAVPAATLPATPAAAVAPAAATPVVTSAPAVPSAAGTARTTVVPAPTAAVAPAAAATPAATPATTPAPAPTPRIVTRRSRAS